jgi:uncharacterized protein YktB (UPF0637 family)
MKDEAGHHQNTGQNARSSANPQDRVWNAIGSHEFLTSMTNHFGIRIFRFLLSVSFYISNIHYERDAEQCENRYVHSYIEEDAKI